MLVDAVIYQQYEVRKGIPLRFNKRLHFLVTGNLLRAIVKMIEVLLKVCPRHNPFNSR